PSRPPINPEPSEKVDPSTSEQALSACDRVGFVEVLSTGAAGKDIDNLFTALNVGPEKWSIVLPELDAAKLFPGEHEPLGIDHCKLAGDKARITELTLGDLSFA